MKLPILGVGFLVLVTACQPNEEKKGVPGIDLANMDRSANPKEDFYQFANGGWIDTTDIPGDRGRWGSFDELREANDKTTLSILEGAAKNPKFLDGSDERKAIDFFSVGMDTALAERVGVKAVANWYTEIDNLKQKEELQSLIAKLQRSGYPLFFEVGAQGDLMNSDVNAMYVSAGGLGLPNKEYYTKTDDRSVEIREKYITHVARMLALTMPEDGDFTDAAKGIMTLESTLAEASKSPIELRDIPALYNLRSVSELGDIAPIIDWKQYFIDLGLATLDTVIVTEPKFLGAMNNVIGLTDLAVIKSYMKWCVINRASPYMNEEVVNADFDFYSKELNGVSEQRDRWKRVLQNTNGALGEALGKVYVAETFPPEAKQMAEEMVGNLIEAFDARIKNLEWMSDSTKEQALKKLGSITVKIGYPNKWKDYSDLAVEASGESYSYLKNVENASAWNFKRDMEKVGKPVDKEEWGMNPQTVNAYYNPLNNEIVFPAAILQPPFFNFNADPAVNYGGMGAVIGHEISHGFDDQGSRFDSEGNMVNWWSATDKDQFDARATQLVAQYDGYEALDSVFVQGKLTLGENIGDLGGLNAAYDGLQIHFQKKGRTPDIDGLTAEQRFFISWATIWRTKYRDETLRTQILTDPHSPGQYRAIGPLVNMESFFKAFDIKEGDPIFKPEAERVKIW